MRILFQKSISIQFFFINEKTRIKAKEKLQTRDLSFRSISYTITREGRMISRDNRELMKK